MTAPRQEKTYDVCLLLEGTYPYVSGGVSSWLHRLISGMPDLSFTAVCIVPSSKEKLTAKYQMPPNFAGHRVMPLHDVPDVPRYALRDLGRRQVDIIRSFHAGLKERDFEGLTDMIAAFRQGEMPLSAVLHGRKAWNMLLETYRPDENNESFLNFFWTFRLTHLAMFRAVTFDLPKARVYHSISTGYAGLLGATARTLLGRPFLLTEHGIYVKERKIEISQADWIYKEDSPRLKVSRGLTFFQDYWVRIFSSLARIAYSAADRIYTLYEGNRQLEIAEGAPEDKIEIIPNGIEIERFMDLPRRAPAVGAAEGFAVGFVGRVVPIKDVKTFIRAVKIVSSRVKVTAYVMGPFEEDEGYYQECRELVELLGLQQAVVFTGPVNVAEYYPRVDLIVLTSISEAQPLVIMEANCAGVPAVATDVGSCRELLEGRTSEDRALGPSGMVTRTADPIDTARAMGEILTNPALRERMAQAGKRRIATFYRESDLLARYHDIYTHYREQP